MQSLMKRKKFYTIIYIGQLHTIARYPSGIIAKDLFFVVSFQLIQSNNQQLFDRRYFVLTNKTPGG